MKPASPDNVRVGKDKSQKQNATPNTRVHREHVPCTYQNYSASTQQNQIKHNSAEDVYEALDKTNADSTEHMFQQ